jgi:hypothetical protein
MISSNSADVTQKRNVIHRPLLQSVRDFVFCKLHVCPKTHLKHELFVDLSSTPH